MSSTAQNQDDYGYWRAMLADPSQRLPIVENEPQPGFYMVKRKDNLAEPVAIWFDGGLTVCLRGGESVGDNRMVETWTSCARHPITQDRYNELLQPVNNDDPIYGVLPIDPEELAARAAAILEVTKGDASPETLADAHNIIAVIEKRIKEKEAEELEPLTGLKDKFKDLKTAASTAKSNAKSRLKAVMERDNLDFAKGQIGNKISWRERKSVVVTNFIEAVNWVIENDPCALEKAVNSAVKEGAAGTEVQIIRGIQ